MNINKIHILKKKNLGFNSNFFKEGIYNSSLFIVYKINSERSFQIC